MNKGSDFDQLSDDDIARIAAKVSTLMQLDRMRHHVGTEIDMKAQANLPAYIASVFEEANAVSVDMVPRDFYALVTHRLAQMQAQLYMMRLELENRDARDPADIYTDPLVIGAYSAYEERAAESHKAFGFEGDLLAYGWYPVEKSPAGFHRWSRPGERSVVCIPHLGGVAQRLKISAHVLVVEQFDELRVTVAGAEAEILRDAQNPVFFTACFDFDAAAVKGTNQLPVEFRTGVFRQFNDVDTRLLGVNVLSFTLDAIRS